MRLKFEPPELREISLFPPSALAGTGGGQRGAGDRVAFFPVRSGEEGLGGGGTGRGEAEWRMEEGEAKTPALGVTGGRQ